MKHAELAADEWYRIAGDSLMLTLTQSAAVAWGAQSRGATVTRVRLTPLDLVGELPAPNADTG